MNNKEATPSHSRGKLSVSGCNTAWDESHSLKAQAKRSKKAQKERERTHVFMIVPIFKGVLEVELNKFNGNKKYYEDIAIGEIYQKK